MQTNEHNADAAKIEAIKQAGEAAAAKIIATIDRLGIKGGVFNIEDVLDAAGVTAEERELLELAYVVKTAEEVWDERRGAEGVEPEHNFSLMIAELRDLGGIALDRALAKGEAINKHLVLADHITGVVLDLQKLGWDRDNITAGIHALLDGFDRRLREVLSTPMAEGGAQ